MIVEIKVEIIKITDYSAYPGWCEVVLTDAHGVEHHFQDKIPIFTAEDIDLDTVLPVKGIVAGEVLTQSENIVKVSTRLPDDVESVEGLQEFEVFEADVQGLVR
ncbi:MAG: hypothetical protein IJ379_12850 [Lachnospiraceae bacterium]|nr:hypothetical protein [Lachnospiraceae bacterium]